MIKFLNAAITCGPTLAYRLASSFNVPSRRRAAVLDPQCARTASSTSPRRPLP